MKGMEDEIEVMRSRRRHADVTLLGEAEQAPVVKLVQAPSSPTRFARERSELSHIEPYERTASAFPVPDQTGTLYRDDGAPVPHEGGDHFPFENHGRAGHRRAARSPGRSHQAAVFSAAPSTCASPDSRRSTARKVVMRILDKGNLNIDLTQAGIQEQALSDSRVPSRSPYGMAARDRARPGAEKTTNPLLGALETSTSPRRTSMTAEDPVSSTTSTESTRC